MRRREKAPEHRCGACGDTTADMALHLVEDYEVMLCVNPVTCRLRAQKKGVWCTWVR